MNRNIKLAPLAIILAFSLFAASCDLITGIPRDDLLDVIDDEIRWANAEPVSVSVMYPADWGTSTQAGVNNCGDVRVGFAFDLDFSPFPDFSILEWRAYLTAELDEDDRWIDNPAAYLGETEDEVKLRAIQPIDTVDLPGIGRTVSAIENTITESGGRGKVIIYSTEPVTLIPFSRAQPRILSSAPNADTRIHSGVRFHGRLTPISITFAAPLDRLTAEVFHGDNLSLSRRTIAADGVVNNDERAIDGRGGVIRYYKNPRLLADNRTIIIEPILEEDMDSLPVDVDEKKINYQGELATYGGPPANVQVTLVLGTGVKTARGASWKSPVTFVWRTRANNCFVADWKAQHDGNRIHVEWTQVGGTRARVYHRRIGSGGGRGQYTEISGDENETMNFYINSASFNGSNGEGYQIWIEPISREGEVMEMEDNESIMVWNIPGMVVEMGRPARAIRSHEDINGIILNNPDVIYVLADNINLTSTLTPIGTETLPFKGEFYGLGKTLTINNEINNNQYMGVFGFIDGAKIYDLTVEYQRTQAGFMSNSDIYFGGLIGYSKGQAVINNCIVRSGNNILLQNLNSAANRNVYMGGLIGCLDDQTTIRNSSSAININIEKSNNGEIFAGGLIGQNTGTLRIYGDAAAFAAGNVTIAHTGGAGAIYSSGLIGQCEGSLVINSTSANVSTGNITVTRSGNAPIYSGGVIGRSTGFAGITGSFSIATSGIISITGPGAMYAGGAIGYWDSTVEDNHRITNLNAVRNITVTNNESASSNEIFAGGMIGYSTSSRPIVSSAATGTISATHAGTGAIYSGGMIGYSSGSASITGTSPVAISGDIDVEGKGAMYVGGVIGHQESTASVTFTNLDVSRKLTLNNTGTGTADIYAGGLIGLSSSSHTITGTKSTGSIGVTYAGTGKVYTGGVIGHSTGAVSITGTSPVEISGNISVTGGGNKYVGGVIGTDVSTSANTNEISNLNVSRSITVNGNGSEIFTGGIIGNKSNAGKLLNITYSGNITLDNNGAGTHYVGGIAGTSIRPDFENCTVTGNITIGATSNNSTILFVGGIAGDLHTNGGTVKNSIAQGNINIGTASVRSPAHIRVGGIAGSTVGASQSARTTFEDCEYKTGNITIYSSTSTGTDPVNRIGGFVGYAQNVFFRDCKASAALISVNKTGDIELRVGGFIGEFPNNAYVSFEGTNSSSSNINVTSASFTSVGGFAGRIYGAIRNVTSTGNVTATATHGSSYDLNVGGLVGRTQNNLISGSSATGTVTGTSNGVHSALDGEGAAGDLNIGGLVGHTTFAIGTEAGNNATGAVTATTSGTGALNIGGLVGLTTSTIASGSASGTVTATATGSGAINAGGLIGRTTSSNLSSHNSASGTVTAEAKSTGAINAGGLVGLATGGISDSYAAGSEVKIADSSGELNAGGLVGYTTHSVSRSWARNNVIVEKRSGTNGDGNIGGLIGYASGPQLGVNPGVNPTVENCYALGDVSVIGNTTNYYVGGLVGYSNNCNINNNFARGEVKLRSNAAIARAGGIVGFANDGSRPGNNFALGDTVTATSGSAGVQSANRMSGNDASISSTNYARANMRTGISSGGAGVGDIAANIPADSMADGEARLISRLKTQNGWTASFTGSIWSNSSITEFGFPMLSGVGEEAQRAAREGRGLVTPSYAIATNKIGEGTITVASSAIEGTTVSVTLGPDAGYLLSTANTAVRYHRTDDPLATTNITGSGNTRTFTMPNFPITITATFVAQPQTITKTAPDNGEFEVPETAVTDATVRISNINPATGFSIGTVSVIRKTDNQPVDVAVDGNDRIFTMPAGGVTVTVTFIERTYTISRYNNGDAGNGNSFVLVPAAGPYQFNSEITINASPSAGWQVTGMTYTYVPVGLPERTDNANRPGNTGNTGTFNVPNAAGDITVNVIFGKITYTIDQSTPVANGTFTVTVQDDKDVQVGETIIVTGNPDAGYRLSTVTVNGNTTTIASGNTHTFAMPASDVTVTVGFSPLPQKVGGSITGKGKFTINGATFESTTAGTEINNDITDILSGQANVTVVFEPAPGYALDTVNTVTILRTSTTTPVPNVTQVGNTYTIASMPGYPITITVTFTAQSQTITKTPPSNGAFEVPETAATDATVTIGAINPSEGYAIGVISVLRNSDNQPVSFSGDGNSRTFTMPAGGVTVSISFVHKTFTVARENGGNLMFNTTNVGTFSVSAPALGGSNYNFNEEVTVTTNVTAAGYQITNITATGNNGVGTIDVTDGKFTIPLSAPQGTQVTVSVTVEKINYTITRAVNPVGSGTFPMRVTPAGGTAQNNGASLTSVTAQVGDTIFIQNNLIVAAAGYQTRAIAQGVVTITGFTPPPNITASTAGGNQNNHGYTFTMPASDITVTLALIDGTYTINRYGGGNDGNGNSFTLTPPAGPYSYNSMVTINATTAAGWQVTEMTYSYDGNTVDADITDGTENKTGTFRVPHATETITVNVEFEKITYNNNSPAFGQSTSTTNGSFTVTGTPQVGNTITVTGDPATGYRLSTVTVNGTPTTVTSYPHTFIMPPADITVTAEFALKTFTVPSGNLMYNTTNVGTFTASAPAAGGTIYNFGEEVTITTNVTAGYQVTGMTATGNNGVGAIEIIDGKFTIPLSAPQGTQITVSVTVEKITYTIYRAVDPDGAGAFPMRVTPAGGTAQNNDADLTDVTAQVGDTIFIQNEGITVNTGFVVKAIAQGVVTITGFAPVPTITATSTGQAVNRGYSFTMPASDITVTMSYDAAP
ncbi:MAG: hypothetical protein FWD26_07165 [Treponema sp.]|nr:hypothetical protein [Treponema sp.]